MPHFASSRETFYWHVNFVDPDLTITVDLEREEQEKNGRRGYNDIIIQL